MAETENQRILAYLREHQDEMVAHLQQLVELESPTSDKAAIDRLGAVLAEQLRAIGAAVDVQAQASAGNHLRARWGAGQASNDGLLLLTHMDTVWDTGTIAQRPVRIEDGRLYGPGAFDMKGGIVNAVWAIRSLRELGLMPERRITLLVTSDEETGSHTSRPLIEEEAKQHRAVYVLEPAHPPRGSLKTWRKGVGDFEVIVTGKAAHAGAAHDEGVNAIEELAYQIISIQALTDYAVGTTVNVGVVSGGTRSNVVPAQASAHVDVRVMNAAEADRVYTYMHHLIPRLTGTTIEVRGGMNRPPMVRTPQTVALFAIAQAIALELGLSIDETGTGGGSDGNFTSALGVPTLDGLGVDGDGSHAQHEHVIVTSLPERAALLAGLLRARQASA